MPLTRLGPRAGKLLIACAVLIAATIAQARAVTVDLPATAGAPPDATTTVPLTISSATGVLGIDIVISFDAAVVTAQSVSKTTLSESHALTTNLSIPGLLRVSLFGATPLSGGGDLLSITLRSTGPPGGGTPLHFETVQLNEGQIPAASSDGHYCVQGRPDEVLDLQIAPFGSGDTAALMRWNVVPYAAGYNVYRGADVDLADLACFLPFVTSTSAVDDGAVPAPGGLFVFLIASVNCSDESTLGSASSGQERIAPVPCP